MRQPLVSMSFSCQAPKRHGAGGHRRADHARRVPSLSHPVTNHAKSVRLAARQPIGHRRRRAPAERKFRSSPRIGGVAKTTLVQLAAVLAAALGIWPAAAMGCIRVGVYQDRPATSFPRLQTAVGPGVTTLSVYVGAHELVDPRVIALARGRHLLLVVAWQPDD